MKNIRYLFDTLSPSDEQITRMAEQIETKASKKTYHPVKRILTAAAAAVLLIGSTVTAAAYVNPEIGETVRKFFTREEKLIDEKAVMIDEKAEENGIILTVDKAFRDENIPYLSCTLKNSEGLFDGYILTADKLTVAKIEERTLKDGSTNTYTTEIISRPMGDKGIYAGEILKLLPDEPSDTVRLILELPHGEDPEGEYTLTLDRLYSVETVWNSVEDTPHTEYAEKLEVTFDFGEIADEVEVYEEAPMLDFELFGGRVTFESIRVSPIEIELNFTDRYGDLVAVEEFPEITFSPIEYIGWFRTLSKHPDVSFEAYLEISKPLYRVEVTFRDNVSERDAANSYGRYDVRYGEILPGVKEVIRLTDPIFPSDIEKISLVCRETGDEIVLWTGKGKQAE